MKPETPSPQPEDFTVVTIQVPGRKVIKVEGVIARQYASNFTPTDIIRYVAAGLQDYAVRRSPQPNWREVSGE